MGAANDFMNSFLEQYPAAKTGHLSLDELNRLMAEHQQKMNARPLEDFDGISPAQMAVLLREPFSAESILRFKPSIEHALSELLLGVIRDDGQLKLTVTGKLPVRVCELLVSQQLIQWPYMDRVTRVREDEIPWLPTLKQCLVEQGIIKKRNNALSLTAYGEGLLKESAAGRFKKLFVFFAGQFNWMNFYGLEDGGRYGQLGWAYSLVLLARYGATPQESYFYSQQLMRAFEKELYMKMDDPRYEKDINMYRRAYDVRFFETFADWFGLVHIGYKNDLRFSYADPLMITKTDLFGELFVAMGDAMK